MAEDLDEVGSFAENELSSTVSAHHASSHRDATVYHHQHDVIAERISSDANEGSGGEGDRDSDGDEEEVSVQVSSNGVGAGRAFVAEQHEVLLVSPSPSSQSKSVSLSAAQRAYELESDIFAQAQFFYPESEINEDVPDHHSI